MPTAFRKMLGSAPRDVELCALHEAGAKLSRCSILPPIVAFAEMTLSRRGKALGSLSP